MSVAEDLFQTFRTLDGYASLPRVRALHCPRDLSRGGKSSSFCAIELTDGTLGLAYIALSDTRERMAGFDPRTVDGVEALELVAEGLRRDGLPRALGFATINALSRWFLDRAGYEPPTSADSLGGLIVAPQERFGMVGLFAPLIERLVASGSALTVLELPPESPGERGGYRVTLDPEDLRDCTQVICTSTVLLNDSLDGIRQHCVMAREFVVIGPGAGCLPDPLFSRGVTRLGGSWIIDPAGIIDALKAGRGWTSHARKFDLDRATYPGFEALLARL